MNEKLLHFAWKYKRFINFPLVTTDGSEVTIIQSGIQNGSDGPDFSFAKLIIDGIEWNGNVEIHVKTSDWNKHQHSDNQAYHSIILHVVYEHDTKVNLLEEKSIKTLALKPFLDENWIYQFDAMLKQTNQFIPCEKSIASISENTNNGFFEKLYFDKLSLKISQINEDLLKSNNNWEAILFVNLAYCMGLKVNALTFKNLAQSVDFKIIQKIQSNRLQLEALFFGLAGFLDHEVLDDYMQQLQQEFLFISKKYDLNIHRFQPKFGSLLPPNFPTIRLAQLAAIYYQFPTIFTQAINGNSANMYYQILENITASNYWDNHYIFGKISEKNQIKKLSKDRMDLIILNGFLPIKFAYSRYIDHPMEDEILDILSQMKVEKNSIIERYNQLNVKAKNALESQALVYLYQHYCTQKKCLECSIGYQLFR